MKLYLANPIYDAVFKYLMEDERIARTLISALLKKKVVHLEQRPHEYVNTTRNNISMFRIDFGATIREDDGHEHLVLIQLQKTWLETETLRFRQYLGAQYNRKENIVGKGKATHALPMVAVYILGHLVDGFHVPVVYVNHKTYDYDGNLLETNAPSPFVDSLTHNSIIVQIPLLHGQVNNRLEKVLSVFDQTRMSGNNTQTLAIDENQYADDSDMMYLLHRLTAAAASAEIRQDMNVEDEYYQAIEDRDTALMLSEEKVKKQEKQISEQTKQLDEQAQQLNEKNAQMSSMAKALAKSGMSAEAIAAATGIDVDNVKALLG